MVQLNSLNCGLRLLLVWFAAKGEAAGTAYPGQGRVAVQVSCGSCSRMMGKREREIEKLIGAASALMRILKQSEEEALNLLVIL